MLIVTARGRDVSYMPGGKIDAIHWADSLDLNRCPPAGAEVVRRLVALGLID